MINKTRGCCQKYSLTIFCYLLVGDLEAILSDHTWWSTNTLNVGHVTQLKWLVTCNQRLINRWEPFWMKINSAKPLHKTQFLHSLCKLIESNEPVIRVDGSSGLNTRNNDVVGDTKCWAGASSSSGVRTGLSIDGIPHHIILDTTVTFLCPDTVLVVLTLDLCQTSVVVAL